MQARQARYRLGRRYHLVTFWSLVPLFLGKIIALGATSLLDPSFDPGSGPNGPIHDLAVQSDGKILVCGSFSSFRDIPRSQLARLNPDGTLDLTFDAGPVYPDYSVQALVLQPDGRIVLVGSFLEINRVNRRGVARLLEDGSVDPSFDPGHGVFVDRVPNPAEAHAVALKADGRIVIGGNFSAVDGMTRNGVAQLNADGSLDLGFDPGHEFYVGWALAVQADGKVLVGCVGQIIDGLWRQSIARLDLDGSLDRSFAVPNPGVGVLDEQNRIHALALQPDGMVLPGGLPGLAGANYIEVARLHRDGSLDPTLETSPMALGTVNAVAVQPDGRIIVGGTPEWIDHERRGGVARLMADGSTDLGFDPGSGIGALPNFGYSQPWVNSLALQPDGRVIVAGCFELFDGVLRKSIARLDRGSDTDEAVIGFDPASMHCSVSESAGVALLTVFRFGSHARVLTVDYETADQSARAGADYSEQRGTLTFGIGERKKVVAIPIVEDPWPEVDEVFLVTLKNPSAGASLGNNRPLEVTILEDDPGLEFEETVSAVDETNRMAFVSVRRLGPLERECTVEVATAAGTAIPGLDYAERTRSLWFRFWEYEWQKELTFNFPVFDDGLVEGSETVLLTLRNPSVGVTLGARHTATVVIWDNDIPLRSERGANDTVRAILPLADGTAIVAGDFSEIDGRIRRGVARVHGDGALDESFDPGEGVEGSVHALALQPDGRVLLAGAFARVGGQRRQATARLEADGRLDVTFDPGLGVEGAVLGFEAAVHSIIALNDGGVLIGGYFTRCGGLAREGIARLHGDGSVDADFHPAYGQAAAFPLLVQSDGSILAASHFAPGGPSIAFARLNADGKLDGSFRLGGASIVQAQVFVMAAQEDGQILMGGRFGYRELFDGMLRFNRDGSLDPTFMPADLAISRSISCLVVQEGNRPLIGGKAYIPRATNPRGITRLGPDGSRDWDFLTRVDLEGDVLAIVAQPGGTILMGGSFLRVNGLPRRRLAQLNADGTVGGSVELNLPAPLPDGTFRVSTRRAPGIGQVVEASSNLGDWLPIFTNPSPARILEFIDVDAGRIPQRFYRSVQKP